MSTRLAVNEEDGRSTRSTSPNGHHVWLVDEHEVRMSLWILEGELWRSSPPTLLFKSPSGWSFETRDWVSNEQLRMVGRRFPGTRAEVSVSLDVRTKSASIENCVGRPHHKPSPPAPVGEVSFAAAQSWLAAFPRD